MSFKIACDAGHYKYTTGNRVPKKLDGNQTSEWVLNDRVARHFADAAKQYEGVELLRVDDTTGKTDVSLFERCKRANEFGADFYLSIHHNAGANLTTAGGIEAYSYTTSAKGKEYRDAIYDACIAAGGLKGNRATPKKEARYYVLRYTVAPSALIEYGFMDSTKDAPVILQEEYSKKVAYATMEAIAKVVGLRKKAVETKPEAKPKESGVIYRVQVGAFSIKDNAVKLKNDLQKAGFDAFVVESTG
jgi:N-acetylmuramoyl-L-alanine amidase